MNPVPVATSLVLICNVEEVLLSVPDEVFSSVPVEAQAARKDKTIGAKRNHLNFIFLDISSSAWLSVSSNKDKPGPVDRIRVLFFCFQLSHSQRFTQRVFLE